MISQNIALLSRYFIGIRLSVFSRCKWVNYLSYWQHVNHFLFQKFVCTTIRPTQLPYEELYNWDGAGEYVADYLDFVPLGTPFELVNPLVRTPQLGLKRLFVSCNPTLTSFYSKNPYPKVFSALSTSN